MGGGGEQLACSPLQCSELVRHTGRQGGLAVVQFLKSKQSLNQNPKPCKFSNTSPFFTFLEVFFLYRPWEQSAPSRWAGAERTSLLGSGVQPAKKQCHKQCSGSGSVSFWPPRSVRGSQRYGSGTFDHQAKIVRNPLFLLFCDFFMTLKNDVNVPSKSKTPNN
jgi:hypothetical protein